MDKFIGKLYTVSEVAALLNVDVRTVYLWQKEKKLPALKLGGTTWRIREKDLKLFIMGAFEEGEE